VAVPDRPAERVGRWVLVLVAVVAVVTAVL
jgi:hypothetical protein